MESKFSEVKMKRDDSNSAANISLFLKRCWKKMPYWIQKIGFFSKKEEKVADSKVDFVIQEYDNMEKNSEQKEMGKFFPNAFSLRLLQRFLALEYRLEKKKLIFEKTLFQSLQNLAFHWSRNQPVTSRLTPKGLDHLRKTAHYSDFCKLLEASLEIRKLFFIWALQDENDPAIFIEFPALAEKMLRSNLSSRIGRLGSLLKIRKIWDKGKVKKIVTLPFEGRPMNILDPQARVTFKGSYSLTIEEIFQVFEKKEVEVGNLELMQEGIINWNAHQLGYWNEEEKRYVQVDLTKAPWWSELPHYEVLSRKQLAKRYQMEIKEAEWIAVPKATRGKANLDFLETHAFLEVAIPLQQDQYAIYDFGKLALKYPSSAWEKLSLLTKTVHATVAYPDENIYYNHRQHGFHPFRLNRKQGLCLMELIKRDIEISRQLNFIYQIESENCAKWVHDLLEKVLQEKVPDFFRMQLLDTEPEGFIAHLFGWIKLLPKHWQVPVLSHLHLPLGAARKVWINEEGETVPKSLVGHTFFETGQIFLPALLIAKVAIQPSIRLDSFTRAFFEFREKFMEIARGMAIRLSLQWVRKFGCKEISRRV